VEEKNNAMLLRVLEILEQLSLNFLKNEQSPEVI
jgi:hypothetical protein